MSGGALVDCPTCGERTGHSGSQALLAKCAYTSALLVELEAWAAAIDHQPPSPVRVRDLWGHARVLTDDGTAAARWVRVVLSLGWRPTT